jgi:RecA-family ATPase
MRNLFRLAVLLLIANALYRFAPPYIHYHQFKDAVKEVALFAKDTPEPDVVDRVMVLAERYKIPLQREKVQVTRDKQFTYITLAYEEQIEWVPSYKRPMPFSVSVEGWHVKPAAQSEAFGK